MNIEVPKGARPAARIALLNQDDQLLYLHAREQRSGKEFWVMPGGGLESGENFEDAAKREAWEETGIDIELGPCLWTRHHVFEWEGKQNNQFEVFFLARSSTTELRAPNPDSYIFGHKWWMIPELQRSDEEFAPRKIGQLIGPIIAGNIPTVPFGCGV